MTQNYSTVYYSHYYTLATSLAKIDRNVYSSTYILALFKNREGVRGVAGVATATPILQILFHKIVVLKWPKIPKVQIPQNPNIPKARIPKGPNA